MKSITQSPIWGNIKVSYQQTLFFRGSWTQVQHACCQGVGGVVVFPHHHAIRLHQQGDLIPTLSTLRQLRTHGLKAQSHWTAPTPPSDANSKPRLPSELLNNQLQIGDSNDPCGVPSQFCHVPLFLTLRSTVHQVPLSMEFSRQEYWSGLPCSPPGDLPDPESEPLSLRSPALQAGSLLLALPGRPPTIPPRL